MSFCFPGLKASAFHLRIARLAFLLLVSLGGAFGQARAAGIALVQHIGKDAGTTTTSTLSFTSPNTAGNFIALVIRGGLSNAQVFTVKDSNANTYKQAKQIGSSGSQVTSAIYYAENIAGGANTITVTMTVSGPLRFAILEYSGVATTNSLDATAAASATSTSPNSGNLTTTVSGDLLLGEVAIADTSAFTAGPGYTIRDFIPAEPNTKLITEDQIQAAAGTVFASATLNPSSNWATLLAAFKPAGGVAGSPASITASAGTPQSATVGSAFGIQLQATVKDSFNNPVSGATVTFTAPGSGASGTFAGGVTTATTNASGVATAPVFTANGAAGSYTVTASVSGVASPANFSLTNLSGAASSIAATAGTSQSATVNTAFAAQLQATVRDSFNNPVSGVTVTFAAPGSGASGTFAGGVNTATTNASGVAISAVLTTNGTAGSYTVTATVSGVATPANYSLTNLPGAAANITATAGTPQSATINTAFAIQFQASVKDSFGNPISGITVTFTTPGSGVGANGTFAGGANTATTNATGVATAAVFTANGAAGSYTVTAAVPGVSTPANFSLTNLAGSPASIAATTGTPQSATINTAFAVQFQATVKDSFGNWVSGVTVTFNAPASGASGTFAGGVNTATTNASGVATAPVFTANSTTGTYTVSASVSGVASPANFSLTNLGNPPASIAATAGTPQSVAVNTAFAVQFQVTVTDSTSNPVNGVTVTFAAPGSGASGTFAGGVSTAVTNASGVATAAGFTANSTLGSYTVMATVSGVSTPATFSLTNITGPAANITATAGTPQSAKVGTAFAVQFQATVTDSGGNPVSGATVTFAPVTNSGPSGTFAGGVNTAPTNSSGVATAAVFTANNTAGGPYTVLGSVPGVITHGANFSLTNLGGAPASILANNGATPQSATVNTAFATRLQAVVYDSFGNPVSGVTVTFTAPPSGASGTFSGGVNTATTDANGFATAPVFTANSNAGGPYTVTASVSGVASPANFSLTNLPGAPASVAASTGTPQSTTINTAFAVQLQATVKDSFGNPVSSVTVTFAAPASGPSGTFAGGVNTATTNAQGIATAPVFTADSIAGSYTVTPAVSGATATSNFSLTNLTGAAASVTAIAGTPQSATIGTAFATQLQVVVRDAGNNPVNGVTVTFSAPASGASGSFAGGVNTATTNTQGLATAPVFTANATAGGPYAVNASVSGVTTPANFSLTNLAGAAATITATAGTPQSASVNAVFATQLQATVTDSGGNPVNGVLVTFTAPPSGPSGTFASGINTATTNTLGVATAGFFTANGTAGGPYIVTASVSGVATSASFSLTNVAVPQPNISSLSPASGPVGTPISITGTNFGSSGGTVTFNGITASPTGWFSTSINVPVPAGAATGPVVVTVNGLSSNAVNFTVTPVTITGLSPTSGPAGTVVTITGTNFGPAQGASNVAFGGLNAAITSWSQTTIVVSVPAGLTGTNAVVVNEGVVSSNSMNFSIPAPTITSLNPTSGLLNTSVTITGTSFGSGQQTSTVSLNGTAMGVSSWSDTRIVAFVPLGATTGPVVVTTPSGTSNGIAFTVIPPPNIVSVNPTSGTVGTSVTITGTSFGASQGTSSLTFAGLGGVSIGATPTSWSDTSVTAPVPSGAATGNVVVTRSGIASNGVNFTVTPPPPSITSLSQPSAAVGALVSISGSNFGSSQGTSTVTFNGTSAGSIAPTSWSSVFITVQVPVGATTGNVVVTVGGVASNGVLFTVTPPPSITSLSPTSGPVGTSVIIAGSNFGSTQGISAVVFNGTTTSAPVTNWSNTSITATVPTGATTGNVVVDASGVNSNGILFTVGAPPAPIALVQHVGKDAGTTTTTTLAFNSANTAGNFIAVAIRGGLSNSQVFTVKDSNSNTYKQAKQIGSSGSAVTSAIYYAENIKSGANTITVTMSVSGPLRIDILEYSGVATSNSLDAAAAATTTSTAPNTGSLTTTGNGDLLLSSVSTADSDTFTSGTGYSIRDFVPVEPNTKLITEDQIQSSAGTASASATLSVSSNWGAILAAFKAAGGTGGGAGTPASITATAGTPQSVTVNTAFATQLQATVKDSLNNPVSGVTVTFTAPGSGASGTFAGGVTTATTNASGVATAAIFTANTIAGSYNVTASVSGVATSANFSLTNLAGAASNITATAGTPQSATINTAFATQLQATVKDSFGNPVGGVTVTFAAPGSGAGGTFAGGVNTATTNASGVATAPVFTANGVTGSYNVTASASGVASPANFSLTNVSAPPASITATAGTPQSATVNTAFTTAFQVTVKDASNNPVSSVTVTFAAPGSGASGNFAGGVNTATTNSSGIATSPVFTANAVAGTYTLTASVAGVGTPANFSLTNLAGSPANIAAAAGTPQSAVINTAFATQLQATITDSLNNPVSGVTVTFTAPGSGASGTFAGGVNTATTNAQGVATAPAFTANATVGGPYAVTASAPGVATQASFSLTNLSTVGNITLVQHRNMDASTQTNNSLAFANNTAAGNFIAVAIRGSGSSSQAFTVSDSSGNTYHQAFSVGLTASLETFAIFYAENIHGGADKIAVTQSVLGTLRFAILEYSGVAASNSLDGTATAQGSSTSPNSGNLTTTANGDLLLATIITKNSGTYTATGGFNIEESAQPAPNTKIVAEDQLQSAAGSVSAGVSLGASDIWGAGLAAFRSVSGAVAPISVSVSPTSASIPAGYGTQAVTAAATNDFLSRGVTWALSGAGCSGSTCGTFSRITTTSVLYTAPSSIPSPATVTVTATSIGDNTKSASATITVTQGVLTVVVSPKRAAVTLSSSPVQFTGNVYNDAQNLGATWQVDGNNGGTAASGTISATGLYTPGTQPGQHTITAVSNANASVSGSALIAVTDLAGVYTNHNDNARTGQNLKEYGLTTATVTPSTFGQLFSCPVDGYVYAQPLWVANLNFSGVTHNVVFIATEHESVYAFDADSPNCLQLWQTNFLSSGVTTLTSADVGSNTDIIPEIGITSTPVIDPATNTLYVVPKTRETVGTVNGQACSAAAPCFVHRLHALDLITGAEKTAFNSPVVISAANFVPQKHLQRPALLLANNTVYLAFGSHGDLCNYQGWLMGYNAATLAQTFATAVSNPSSGCNQGSIWQSGGGPSADAGGNVYVVTANGLYDGTSNFGDTVLKFNSTGSMPPADWFTPFNQATLAANDVDLGSAAVLILPDAVGSAAHPHLAITTGKDAVVYLLDQTNMGKFNSSSNNDVQELVPVPPANTTLDDGGNYVGPAYWNGNIYLTGQNYPLMQFQIANGVIATPQFASSSNTFPPRGGAPVVSANGPTGGIVWIIDYSGFQDNTPAILDAYDANNVGTLLFSSPASGTGSAGNGVKFTPPTVANARVYVGGQFVFTVYGLLPN